jgi:hypothetical protein
MNRESQKSSMVTNSFFRDPSSKLWAGGAFSNGEVRAGCGAKNVKEGFWSSNDEYTKKCLTMDKAGNRVDTLR